MIEKDGKDKLLLTNWQPISLINVDTKIFSKCLAVRLIDILPSIIHHNQVAYVKGRFIGEGVRLIEGIMDYTRECNLPGILLTIDFAKTFDSLSWDYLWEVLAAFGFPDSYISMVKLL